MVYNNTVYKPSTLSERLQAKFGERGANAVFKASSNSQTTPSGTSREVLSFFGRVDDIRSADRAIPSRKRTAAVRAVPPDIAMNRTAASTARNARGQHARRGVSSNARPVQRNARPANTAANSRMAGVRGTQVRANTQTNTGTFARAYAAGEQIRRAAAEYSVNPRRAYARGAAPSGALRRGRSNIPGSRHAVLVTAETTVEKKSIFKIIKDAFSDRHIAEHRVKKSPFPLSYITMIGICAFMVMVLISSFSLIGEYNGNINMLSAKQEELSKQAAKLEVKLEERDDIRNIEKIAVESIGMVSSDMVKSKFVSVSASDRVEVYTAEAEEEEGGLSALLSAIGERFGKIGEYFN